MSDETPAPETVRAAPWRSTGLIGGVAFLGGVAVTAIVLTLTGLGPRGAPVAAPPAKTVVQPQPTVPALPAGTDMATLNAREQALAGKIDQLELRIRDLNGSAQNASGYATRAERLMLAFAVRRAIERGETLGLLEPQLRARFGEKHGAAVDAIVNAARQPVTIEDLRVALDAIAPQLGSGADDGLWGRVRRILSDLVVVRQKEIPSPRTADRLRRARRALAESNVEAAIAEVAHTPGAGSAESWLGAARRYLAARRGLDEIERAAIAEPVAQPAPPAAES